MSEPEPAICPECGGTWPEGRTCQALFEEFLVWEFQDAAYGRVHFLTVAVFMSQHGRYTDEAQAWIQTQLHRHLEGGHSVADIRRMAQQSTSQANRTWKVVRAAGDPPARKIAWTMTIADVAQAHELAGYDAAVYCAQVTAWAQSTLRQLETDD
jgi:hypothetical protein